MTHLPQSVLFALLALPLALPAGARAADLDYGYDAPPRYERPREEPRLYEHPPVYGRPEAFVGPEVVERPVVVERRVLVERPFYPPRPFWRSGYDRPYRYGFYGPRHDGGRYDGYGPGDGWRHDRRYGWER